MELVDTHAHLDFTDDALGWMVRAKEAEVGKIICVGTSVAASGKCVEIAETLRLVRLLRLRSVQVRSPQVRSEKKGVEVFATVGIHPQDGQGDIKKFGSLEKCVDELKILAKSSSRVVAVGECGLDYYVETTDREKEFQRELFGAQVRLAADLGLPLIVHCRNGWEEIFEILSNKGLRHSRPDRESNGMDSRFRGNDRKSGKPRGLFHSWTGDWEEAKKALNLGFFISFSGIVTFKNAPNVQEAAKKMPLSRMLVETDSPFLSPEPYRGMKNEPKNVKITAQFIADLRGDSIDKIAEATSRNAGRLFGKILYA